MVITMPSTIVEKLTFLQSTRESGEGEAVTERGSEGAACAQDDVSIFGQPRSSWVIGVVVGVEEEPGTFASSSLGFDFAFRRGKLSFRLASSC